MVIVIKSSSSSLGASAKHTHTNRTTNEIYSVHSEYDGIWNCFSTRNEVQARATGDDDDDDDHLAISNIFVSGEHSTHTHTQTQADAHIRSIYLWHISLMISTIPRQSKRIQPFHRLRVIADRVAYFLLSNSITNNLNWWLQPSTRSRNE